MKEESNSSKITLKLKKPLICTSLKSLGLKQVHVEYMQYQQQHWHSVGEVGQIDSRISELTDRALHLQSVCIGATHVQTFQTDRMEGILASF